MIDKKSWEEFRNAGLLGFMNMILHIFGWAIVYDFGEKGKIKEVYPARVKFRGFDDKSTEKIYRNVSRYLKENIKEISREAEE